MGQPAEAGTHTALQRTARGCAAALALAAATALAACGSGDDPGRSAATTSTAPSKVQWTLVLDYEPSAIHAGLLRAERAGYFDRAGIDLDIVAPSSTSDALTQVSRGKAELGLADLIDVARRNERAATASGDGETSPDATAAVAVDAAIVQRPLSGLLVDADSSIKTPADLAGKRIAVSGLPSDIAVIDAMVQSGGKPLPTDTITLGFNGLKALHAGRVEASTAYWPADEVTLSQLGTEPRTFALDEFGGPAYPGLVAFSSAQLRIDDPAHVQGFADALAHGTRDVIADPAAGRAAVADSYPELDPATTEAQLDNLEPLFGTAKTAGRLDPSALAAFTAFAARAKLTSRRLDVTELTATPPATTTP